MSAIVRGATKVAKKVAKRRGRPKGSKKGRKAIPQKIKDKAAAAGFPSVKKWKEAGSPEPPKKKKKAGKNLTKKELAEILARPLPPELQPKKLSKRWQKVKDQQEQSMQGLSSVTGPRRRMVSGVAEGPNSPALSKVIPPKMSAAQRRARIAQGIVGGPRAARPGRKGEQVRDIGEYAPPRQQVADAMGLTGRGQSGLGEGLPSLEELAGMGFQITKKGGQIKGKSKKSSNKYRGWGAARKPKGSK